MLITEQYHYLLLGVIKHRDVFSAKYLTAIITDENDRGFFVPIKKTVGHFFVTTLAGNIYAFTLEGARLITYREILARAVKFIEYDTSHFKSLQSYQKELELFLEKNRLPKMNRVQLAFIRIAGRKERQMINDKEVKVKKIEIANQLNELKDRLVLPAKIDDDGNRANKFTPIEIAKLLNEIQERSDDFPVEAENMKNYVQSLGIDYIVTPIRKLSESLQEDLITTSASFLGELLPRIQRVDNEHKTISNKPVTSKWAWVKWVLLLGMLLVLVSMIVYGIQHGWFDYFTNMLPKADSFAAFQPIATKATQSCTDAALQAKYPEPLELKIAVMEGRETCKLSDFMQQMVDSTPLPEVEPIQ